MEDEAMDWQGNPSYFRLSAIIEDDTRDNHAAKSL
jgi:hypothetical protein